MKIKTTYFAFFFLMLLSLQAQAYQVVVKGIIVDGQGDPIANHNLLLKTRVVDGQGWTYSKVLQSDQNGLFADRFNVPDYIPKGAVVLTTRTCVPGAVLKKTFKFDPDNSYIRARLQICRPVAECSVRIRTIDIDPQTKQLVADPVGVAPFSFLWENGAPFQRIKETESGEYCVKIRDYNGCIAKACIEVEFPKCQVKIAVRTSDQYPGIYFLQAQPRGVAPYRYVWSTGQTGNIIRVAERGEYCVKMTDRVGCQDKTCVRVGDPALRSTPSTNQDWSVSIFPNPVSDNTSIVIDNLETEEEGFYKLLDRAGNVLREGGFTLTENEISSTLSMDNLSPGLYLLQIITGDQIKTKHVIKN